MKVAAAMELFEKGMREERKARATTEIYVHCLPQLASRVGSPLDEGETNILPIRRSA